MSNTTDLKQDLIYIPESIDNPPSKFGLPDDYYIIEDSGREYYFMEGHWYEDEKDAKENEHHDEMDVEGCKWLRPVPRLTWEREIASKAFEAGGESAYNCTHPQGPCDFDNVKHHAEKESYLNSIK